jgi:hypothetical protein
MVALADNYRSHRVNVAVETTGPGGPPDGFAHFYPANVPLEAILGLPPRGLVPMVTPTFSPLSQPPPSQLETIRQRAKAARLMQHALGQLEAIEFLEWVDRPSWAILRL